MTLKLLCVTQTKLPQIRFYGGLYAPGLHVEKIDTKRWGKQCTNSLYISIFRLNPLKKSGFTLFQNPQNESDRLSGKR